MSARTARACACRRAIRLPVGETKTDEPRVVILTERTVEALRRLPVVLGSPYVFTNPETGKPYQDIRCMFRRACKAAGVKVGGPDGLWLHDHRRGFVTKARRAGIPESVVMKMSGHKTRAVFDRYNIVDETDIREAARKLDERLAELRASAQEPATSTSRIRQSSGSGHEP